MAAVFKFIGVLLVLGLLSNAWSAVFGREISAADFPRYIHVVGVVEQPNYRWKTAVLRVSNLAPRWVEAGRIEFVCQYQAERTSQPIFGDHKPGPGVEQGWMQASYRGDAIAAGQTVDIEVTITPYRMLTKYYEIRNCTAAKTIEQGIALTNAPIDARGGISVAYDPTVIDQRATFRFQYPVLGR